MTNSPSTTRSTAPDVHELRNTQHAIRINGTSITGHAPTTATTSTPSSSSPGQVHQDAGTRRAGRARPGRPGTPRSASGTARRPAGGGPQLRLADRRAAGAAGAEGGRRVGGVRPVLRGGIFYRNRHQHRPAAGRDTCNVIADGAILTLDIAAGQVHDEFAGVIYTAAQMPAVMVAILQAGGLASYLKQHGGYGQ